MSVRMRFFSVYHAAFVLLVRQCSFLSVESFEHVKNLERTPPDKVVRSMSVTMHWYAFFGAFYSYVPYSVLVRFESVLVLWT